MSKKSNTFEFITKAKIIHFNKNYGYSEVNYTNCDTKVKLICPKNGHGVFYQTPYSHLNLNHGCPKCANELVSNKLKSNTIDFITKSKLIHGHIKYDYSLVDYFNAYTKVKIICPKDNHGTFEQIPGNHLNIKKPAGCPKCAILYRANKKKSNTAEFIIKAKLIHGETRYNYSLTNYVGVYTKIKLICPINNHGEFEQMPHDHLKGRGCSLCLYKNEAETLRCLKLLFPNINIFYQYKPYLNKKYDVDFYFEFNGKVYIVEYNGIQHYELAMHFHKTKEKAEIALITQQARDQYGRAQCKENNYNLIEIDCREVVLNKIYDYLKNSFTNLGTI